MTLLLLKVKFYGEYNNDWIEFTLPQIGRITEAEDLIFIKMASPFPRPHFMGQLSTVCAVETEQLRTENRMLADFVAAGTLEIGHTAKEVEDLREENSQLQRLLQDYQGMTE